jgi:hypothetical protein
MVFCFVQNYFFPDNTRVKIFIVFQNLTLDYMTKTLNQIIFFFLNQNQNIFFSNIGNQNIFLEKNHNPPGLFCLIIDVNLKFLFFIYSDTKVFLFCGLGDDIPSHLIFSIIGRTEMYMFAFGFVES